MTKLVLCGDFVKRQTPDSGFSHFEGSWEELEDLASAIMSMPEHYKNNIRPGYKDGVVLVNMFHPERFRSAIVDLTQDTKLRAAYAPRRAGEDPFLRVSAKGNKQPANYASVVLYRADVLAENSERETDAEWEIVAIKARVSLEEEPMDPYTMARNFLHLKGGTKGDFTAEQFAQSIVYWNNHAMTSGKSKWYRRISIFFKNILSSIRDGAKLHANNISDGFWNGFF